MIKKKEDSKKAEPGRRVCYLFEETEEILEEAKKWLVNCITDDCIFRADVGKLWQRKAISFHSFHLLWRTKRHADF